MSKSGCVYSITSANYNTCKFLLFFFFLALENRRFVLQMGTRTSTLTIEGCTSSVIFFECVKVYYVFPDCKGLVFVRVRLSCDIFAHLAEEKILDKVIGYLREFPHGLRNTFWSLHNRYYGVYYNWEQKVIHVKVKRIQYRSSLGVKNKNNVAKKFLRFYIS